MLTNIDSGDLFELERVYRSVTSRPVTRVDASGKEVEVMVPLDLDDALEFWSGLLDYLHNEKQLEAEKVVTGVVDALDFMLRRENRAKGQ